MPIGFVLIKAYEGKDISVYNNLIKISEVAEVHPLFGEYDLIAKIEANSYHLLKAAAEKVGKINHIQFSKALAPVKL